MPYDFEFGSSTAKGGFYNEKLVAKKFNNWKQDKEARIWLKILGYKLDDIKDVRALQIKQRISKDYAKSLGLEKDEDLQYKKADVQVQVIVFLNDGTIKRENISVKKANKDANYNQVDKRKVDSYQKMWKFDDEIKEILKLFTGEFPPLENRELMFKYCTVKASQLKDKRRIFLNNLKPKYLEKIIKFFESKKPLILMDIIKGRGALCAEWLMVVEYDKSTDKTTWALVNINQAIDIFSLGKVRLSKKGSLNISDGIVMQRKGGTPDPESLQFKIKPLIVFDYLSKQSKR